MLFTLMAVGCGQTSQPSRTDALDNGEAVAGTEGRDIAGVDIVASTVLVEVSGCGFAPSTQGSGIMVGPDQVLASGHVVARSDEVTVLRDGSAVAAKIVALDHANDLALLEIDDVTNAQTISYASPVEAVEVDVAVFRDGDVVVEPTTVTNVHPIGIQEVLGSERHTRDALTIELVSRDGDSGGGVWTPDGRLLGVIFGHTTNPPQRGFATSASVVEAFLDEPMPAEWVCDADRSRVVPLS